jgi:COP9 signalosome complex subunit 1
MNQSSAGYANPFDELHFLTSLPPLPTSENYQQVHDYVAKAEHSTIPGDVSFPLKLKIASGAASLAQGKFSQAAAKLIAIPMQEDISGDTIVSPEDIAQYGTLCGLASLSRDQLQRLLDTQASGFLDLVPPLRDALQRYCRADYPGCLRILQELYPSLQLDMVLAPHLETLSETILHKCCIEYLKPYRKVNLAQMATIFSIPVERLIDILASLIGSGRIPNARIDCLSQTLERLSEETVLHRRQQATKKRILAMEQSILNDAHAMMVRVACLENEGARKSHFVDYMESDDEDGDEPMELVAAGNPEDVY